MKNKKRPVGRPKGTKLSNWTKRKIAASKTGQTHSEETKIKIGKGVSRYWNEDEVGLSKRVVKKLTKNEIIESLKLRIKELEGGK